MSVDTGKNFCSPALFADQGSREYAKRWGERLKDRIFVSIFPQLAQGLLEDLRRRMNLRGQPTDEELNDIHEATLTLLYRLLFLLYAESRELLPIREGAYHEASLQKIKEEIADKAGIHPNEVAARIAKAFSATETTLYDRLQRLCAAINRGDPSLNLPAYNGGLFSSGASSFNRDPTGSAGQADNRALPVGSRLNDCREHRIACFLDERKVPDRYLAVAIDQLARDWDEKTPGLVFIDYKSLEVRHLGSIYEGLLQFKLRIADEVSLANDKAERKASGSYYTPDPIVEYLVAETVGPVLEEKFQRLRPEFRNVRKTFDRQPASARDPRIHPPADQQRDVRAEAADKTYAEHPGLVDDLFDFRVLDPAMGSGHFLVQTADFITDRLTTFLDEFPANPVTIMLDRTRRKILKTLSKQGVSIAADKLTDVNLLKRHVLQHCIYGVDLNPMAVELAKVSLWLDACAIGAPLTFLDHHLRSGNSLVGATFQDLEDALRPAAKGRDAILGIDSEPLLRAIRPMIQINQTADASAVEQKQSAREYDAARRDLFGYQIMLDLLVAQHFGYPEAPRLLEYGRELDLTSRERFLESLAALAVTKQDECPAAKLVAEVAALASRPDLRFFHWEIEFPEVFFAFEEAGLKRITHENRLAAGSAGFDAVVGNPPYEVLASKEVGEDLSQIAGFLRSSAAHAPAVGGKLNLYKFFVARLRHLLRRDGLGGMIVPMPLIADRQARGLREMLLGPMSLRVVEAFPEHLDAQSRVFAEANLTTCIFIASQTPADDKTKIRLRVNRGAGIDHQAKPAWVLPADIRRLDPEGLTIPNCDPAEWKILKTVIDFPWLEPLGRHNVSYQGEVNETTHKGFLVAADGPVVLRGANICRYAVRDSWRGNDRRLDKARFLRDGPAGEKATHYRHPRIGFQRSAPQNNFRRLIAAPIERDNFCFDTVSYFLADESVLGPELLLALLNSEFLDWYFDLGSTNSKINEYRLNQLPVPRFDPHGSKIDSRQQKLLAAARWADVTDECCQLLGTANSRGPTLPASVAHVIRELVREVCRIERERSVDTHRERSQLAEPARAVQAALDRILFACYGIEASDENVIRESLKRRRRKGN